MSSNFLIDLMTLIMSSLQILLDFTLFRFDCKKKNIFYLLRKLVNFIISFSIKK